MSTFENRFINEYDIDAHRYAYIKYNPILAQPMAANARSKIDGKKVLRK